MWPQNLVVCTSLNTLHAEDEDDRIGMYGSMPAMGPRGWRGSGFPWLTCLLVSFSSPCLVRVSFLGLCIVYHHEETDDDKTSYLPSHGIAPLLESAIFLGVHIDWDNSLHFLPRFKWTRVILPFQRRPAVLQHYSWFALFVFISFRTRFTYRSSVRRRRSMGSGTIRDHFRRSTASALIQQFYFSNVRCLRILNSSRFQGCPVM